MKSGAIFPLGILIGAGSVQIFHSVYGAHRAELFKQKLRCKTLADSYVKKNSVWISTLGTSVLPMVSRVDFSTSRNSCIAAIVTESQYGSTDGKHETFDVVDIIGGQNLFTASCNNSADPDSSCGNGRGPALMQKQDEAFDEAVK